MPIVRPESRAELVARLVQPLDRAGVTGVERDDRPHRLTPAVEQPERVAPPQVRLRPRRELGPRRPVRVLGRALDPQQRVGAAEVPVRLAGLGLRGRERARLERVEHVLDHVLGGQPLDQLGLLEPDGGLVGDGLEQLSLLVGEGAPAAGHAADDPELLVAGHERGDQQAVVGALLAAHQVEQQRGAARPRGGRVRRVRHGQRQLVVLGRQPPDLARVGGQQLPRPARDRGVQLVALRHGGERLRELRQGGQLVHPPARLLVELRVLDGARHEPGGVHEEVQDVVLELARRLRVQHDDADHPLALADDRDGDHRLEALLLDLRHVLHARIAIAFSRMKAGVLVRATQPVRPSSSPQDSLSTRCA